MAACTSLETFINTTLTKPIDLASGEPAVEVTFEKLWHSYPDFDVYLCGTIDRISVVNNTVEILDYKSTRKWNRNDYLTSYQASTQALFYSWIMNRYPHSLIPDPYATMAFDNRMFLRICGIFLSAKPLPKVDLSPPITFRQEQYEEFECMLEQTVLPRVLRAHRELEAEKEGLVNGQCMNCEFALPCVKSMSLTQFGKRDYRPLENRKRPVILGEKTV